MSSCPVCRSPVAYLDRFVLDSTDGPIEHARTQCLHGHLFCGPVALICDDGSTP